MEESNPIRELYFSDLFMTFYESLPERVKTKFDYVFQIVKTEYLINTRFVKKLEATEFYELRVSISSNEYRTIIFAIDSSNIVESKRIILLNGFLKKSTKDYKKQINLAERILKTLSYDAD